MVSLDFTFYLKGNIVTAALWYLQLNYTQHIGVKREGVTSNIDLSGLFPRF